MESRYIERDGVKYYANGHTKGIVHTNLDSSNVSLATKLDSVDSQLADIALKIDNDATDIYGTYWDKSSSPALTRTDQNISQVVNAGVDATPVFNGLDMSSLFRDFQTVTDSYGNVFIRIPKIYIKKEVNSGFITRRASRFKHDSSWYLPWCFWDFANNKELDYIDIGKYNASLSDDGTKLESKSGKFPLFNKNIVEFRNLAKANGAGYQQLDLHIADLLQTLFVIENATLNSQAVVAGFTNGQYSATHTATVAETNANRIILATANADAYVVGQTIGIGTTLGGNQICYNRVITAIVAYDGSNKAVSFDGAPVNIAIGNICYNMSYKTGKCDAVASSIGSPVSNTSGKYPFVWHGIENLFGNMWQFVDGINITDHQAWVCKNANDYASNLFAAPYEKLGYINANADGYVTELGFDENFPFANFPKTASGGSSTTYYSDSYYQQSGQRVARLGGPWYSGSGAGVFYWSLAYSSAVADLYNGSRLVKKKG